MKVCTLDNCIMLIIAVFLLHILFCAVRRGKMEGFTTSEDTDTSSEEEPSAIAAPSVVETPPPKLPGVVSSLKDTTPATTTTTGTKTTPIAEIPTLDSLKATVNTQAMTIASLNETIANLTNDKQQCEHKLSTISATSMS